MGGKKYKGWKRTSKVKRNRYAGADAIPTMNPSPTVTWVWYSETAHVTVGVWDNQTKPKGEV